jgi:hypothetical protein
VLRDDPFGFLFLTCSIYFAICAYMLLAFSKAKEEKKGVVVEACGDVDDDDDEMEQEEMFIAAHESFGHDMVEWGGPRRGGRLLEPTRFGDWERKGRCTDF